MGALKHVILPLYTILHLIGFYQALDAKRFVEFCSMPLDDGDEEIQTTREIHLVGIIMSFQLAMAYLCGISCIHENSHFRGVVIVWEVIFYGLRTYNAYFTLGLPFDVYSKPGIAAIIAIIGTVLHSMEPGLFTKDKKKTKSG